MFESHELKVTRDKARRGVPGAVERLDFLLKSAKHTKKPVPKPVRSSRYATAARGMLSRWEARWVDNSF